MRLVQISEIFQHLKLIGNLKDVVLSMRLFGDFGPGIRIWAMYLWEFIMIEYVKTWMELKLDRRAVTALEYGLIAGLIVATIAVGFGILGSNLSNKFSGIGASL